MVRKAYPPRKSLRDQCIDKIVGEGIGPESIRITIEHGSGDKKPISIEIQKDWYGDVREKFRTDAEQYFTTYVSLDLEREIGRIYLDIVNEIIKEQEKKTKEEVALRLKQKAAAQMAAAEPPAERLEGQLPETESLAEAVGDWRYPISVKKAHFAKPNTIITVYGQIVAQGKIHSMIKGGQYQCSRCRGIDYIEYERPSYPGDDEAPQIMHRICRFCDEEGLEEGSRDHQQAMQLHRVGIEDKRAVKIELMDTEAYDAIDTLAVVLFDEHAKDVKVGEYVIIRAKFYLQASSHNRRMYHGVLYAHDVRYTNRNTYELRPEDFTRARKLVDLVGEDNVIKLLVFCYSRYRIVWNDLIKEALLYAEVSAGRDVIGKGSENERRKRIHVGIAGNPGLGKSKKARSVIKHDERNRLESAQGGTGKSFTAIVSKEGDSAPTLRIGPLAHAKEAVIVMNELGEISLEEQVHFQDAMEEGQFTVNKHGIHATIRADAVVVWTSNPRQGASFSKGAISLDQIPVRKQIIDRTDLLMIDKPIKDPNKRREFNHLRMELEKIEQNEPAKWKILRNYDQYVKIHLMVAKRLVQTNGYPKLTDEASDILEEADTRLQQQREQSDVPNVGSHRSLDVLLRLSTAIAMLKLKDKIEATDAKHAVSFYNETIKDIQASVVVPDDPAVLACNAMVYILQNESNGLAITLRQLAELASNKDPAVKCYLYQGPKNKLGNVSINKRLRRVRDMLSNISSGKIKQTNAEEAEFLWVRAKEDSSSEEGGESYDTNEGKSTDSVDSADLDLSSKEGKGPPSSHGIQTKLSLHYDNTEPKTVPQPKSQRSAGSAGSAIDYKDRIEENEYKILKACEVAMAKYKDSKAQMKESGTLFETYDVWSHLFTSFPNENWNMDKTRRAIQQQVTKGWVLTRQGDASDRWYLNWRDNGNRNGTNGGGREGGSSQ